MILKLRKKWVPAAAVLSGAAIIAACGETESSTDEIEKVEASEPVEIATYSAAAFFETTSYSLSSPSGYAFSPDNDDILVSSDETGIRNAYAMDHMSGEATALTTSQTDTTYTVSWFPNDRRILVTHDSGGDELYHLYVRSEDGETTDLTPGENVRGGFAGWSDDNASFFVTTNERDARFTDLYRYDTEYYSRELIFQNDEGYALSGVSSDGRYLALVKSRTSADSDLYLADLSTPDAAPLHVTPHEGNIAYGAYDFTPDNSKLIYSTNEFGEFNQAWSYDLATGEKSELIAEDWDVSYVSYSKSGQYRVWGINEDGRTTVKVRDEETGEMLDAITFPNGAIGSIRFNRDESKIAFLLSRDTSPNNIIVGDLTSGELSTLTNALNPEIDESHLVEASVERYESFDRLEIPGILYKPHQASADTPAPALVWVHGGPGGQSRAGYSAAIQHLVNHGYVVFAANNRGSSGYGKTFFHMDDKKHGDVDLKDIVYAKHYLAEQDWVDADRIGIIGGSYGGYMVGAALAFEPEVFEVGINIFGVMNWVRTLESIPPWWESFREALYDEMGDPATDAERHRAISPLFHASNIVKPLLVVQGANDPRVLQVESDEIVEAVRANGVPVEYVLFDDEGHGFTKRVNRITASEAYVTFLDTYLKGKEVEASAE